MNKPNILQVLQEMHRDTLKMFMLRPPELQTKRKRGELAKVEKQLLRMLGAVT